MDNWQLEDVRDGALSTWLRHPAPAAYEGAGVRGRNHFSPAQDGEVGEFAVRVRDQQDCEQVSDQRVVTGA